MMHNVLRGGGWFCIGTGQRSADRLPGAAVDCDNDIGFRLVLEAPAPGEPVVRGGSWDDPPAYARAAFRNRFPPAGRGSGLGLRLVLEAPPPPVK